MEEGNKSRQMHLSPALSFAHPHPSHIAPGRLDCRALSQSHVPLGIPAPKIWRVRDKYWALGSQGRDTEGGSGGECGLDCEGKMGEENVFSSQITSGGVLNQ